jgi:hypothetical protein
MEAHGAVADDAAHRLARPRQRAATACEVPAPSMPNLKVEITVLGTVTRW